VLVVERSHGQRARRVTTRHDGAYQRGAVRLLPEPGVSRDFALILSLKRECQQQ